MANFNKALRATSTLEMIGDGGETQTESRGERFKKLFSRRLGRDAMKDVINYKTTKTIIRGAEPTRETDPFVVDTKSPDLVVTTKEERFSRLKDLKVRATERALLGSQEARAKSDAEHAARVAVEESLFPQQLQAAAAFEVAQSYPQAAETPRVAPEFTSLPSVEVETSLPEVDDPFDFTKDVALSQERHAREAAQRDALENPQFASGEDPFDFTDVTTLEANAKREQELAEHNAQYEAGLR